MEPMIKCGFATTGERGDGRLELKDVARGDGHEGEREVLGDDVPDTGIQVVGIDCDGQWMR